MAHVGCIGPWSGHCADGTRTALPIFYQVKGGL